VYPVGDNGIFATGYFKSVNGKPSFSVAFFDGTKWCPISQGLAFSSDVNNYDQAGFGWAVWCNSATSCYVAGMFSFIENLPTNAPNQVENFAHYIRDNETSSEWVFDTSIIEWNGPDSPPRCHACPPTARSLERWWEFLPTTPSTSSSPSPTAAAVPTILPVDTEHRRVLDGVCEEARQTEDGGSLFTRASSAEPILEGSTWTRALVAGHLRRLAEHMTSR
jgi:hypothetical protein